MSEVCAWCGRGYDDDPTAALTWVTSTEGGRLRRYCPACAREHLRSIEAKLDQEFW